MSDIRPFILGIAGLELTADERALFSEAPPFGVILFLRNVDNPDQLSRLIGEIKSVSQEKTLIFIDQEGGRVQRLAPPFWKQYPIAGDFDQLQNEDFGRAVYALYRLIGDDLARAEIDVNCAPCLDLRSNITATFLQDRTFGHQVERVIEAGHQSIRALNDAGVEAVIKHLPGHGRATVDSHLHLPKVVFDQDPYQVLPDEAKIFQEDYGALMAMNAHILYPQIDPDHPLTLSPKGIDFIKNRLGYQGLIMSDDLAMKALNGTQGQLAKRAFDAGLDVALSCSGQIEDIREIYSLDIEASPIVKTTYDAVLSKRKSRANALAKAERAELESELALA